MTARRMLAALLTLTLAGCAGTETGNPPFAPGVSGASGAPMGVVPDITIERGWLGVASLRFLACEPALATVVREEPAQLALDGPGALETEAVLEEGRYCGVAFERALVDGASLALDAALADETPVQVTSSSLGSIRVEAAAPFEMRAELGGVVVRVDESLLFNGLRLMDAERGPDGTISLDDTRNTRLRDSLDAQLAGSLSIYRDEDGDGRLSTEETRAGPL